MRERPTSLSLLGRGIAKADGRAGVRESRPNEYLVRYHGEYTVPPSKLPQKPQIILVEKTDVVDAIADHGNPLNAKTEGPAAP